MGYTQWRERQLARVDAMTARADERYEKAKRREVEARAEAEQVRVERAAEATSSWAEARARALGEDHGDLLARAGALGIPAPTPGRQRRGRVLGALGELVVMDGAGVESGAVDSYEGWRDRIVVEESMIAKQARGESLTRWDRLALKAARFSSK